MSAISGSGYRPAEPDDDIRLGNVRDEAQDEAAAADKNKDGILTKEEAFVAYANKQPAGATLPKFSTFRLDVPLEHDVKAKDVSMAGYDGTRFRPNASYILRASEHLGDFHIDGMGFGNARFMREPNSAAGDVCHFVVDCGGFDTGMLLDKDTKIRIVLAPRDFKPDDDRLGLPDAVALPCDVNVEASGYSRMGWYPGSKAAMATVDTAKLRELAEGSDKLGFFVEIEAKGHPKSYANLNGEPFKNFVVPADRIR